MLLGRALALELMLPRRGFLIRWSRARPGLTRRLGRGHCRFHEIESRRLERRFSVLDFGNYLNYYRVGGSRKDLFEVLPPKTQHGRRGPAHTCARRAEVSNNCLRRPVGCTLHARVSQIKLLHVGAVAWNAWQRPDCFHARRRAPLLHSRRQRFENVGGFFFGLCRGKANLGVH
jgi:hypothetical protein